MPIAPVENSAQQRWLILSLGSPLGGLISAHLDWTWVFFINVPLGIAAIALAWRVLPSDGGSALLRKGVAGFDLPGAVLSMLALMGIIYGLNQGRELGWGSPVILASLGGGGLALIAFLLWERRCADPMLNLALFRSRSFVLSDLENILGFMLLSGNAFLMPFYLVVVKGLGSDHAGRIMMLASLGLMVAGPLVGRLSDRWGCRGFCVVGLGLIAAAWTFFVFTLGLPGLWSRHVSCRRRLDQ